eukprot:364294-Chlamydomonas_euryale.AAC.9
MAAGRGSCVCHRHDVRVPIDTARMGAGDRRVGHQTVAILLLTRRPRLAADNILQGRANVRASHLSCLRFPQLFLCPSPPPFPATLSRLLFPPRFPHLFPPRHKHDDLPVVYAARQSGRQPRCLVRLVAQHRDALRDVGVRDARCTNRHAHRRRERVRHKPLDLARHGRGEEQRLAVGAHLAQDGAHLPGVWEARREMCGSDRARMGKRGVWIDMCVWAGSEPVLPLFQAAGARRGERVALACLVHLREQLVHCALWAFVEHCMRATFKQCMRAIV